MELKYKIKMLSDWHVGSGLDSATEADALVLKDENNLPYIPGKTLKGLLRDAFQEICDVQDSKIPQQAINQIFGEKIYEEGSKTKVKETKPGKAFFANAYLPQNVALEVAEMSDYLYQTVSSTAIGRGWYNGETEGIAKGKSLRTSQVTIPVELEATISDISDDDLELFEMAFQWLRHLGVSRNRGLGRCQLSINENQSS